MKVLVIGHLWFKVPIRGDLSLIFALSGLFLISSLGIGLFASTIANTQQEAFITVMVTMLQSGSTRLRCIPLPARWKSL
jgi:ABC-2 type transport system permease protein